MDNHDGVVTHLELDVLECEVKWALRSITMNKDSRGDIIPTEIFKTLKDDDVKVLHLTCQQIWKTQLWLQDWKRLVFNITQRKAMPNNVHTIIQLGLIHTLARLCSKSFKLGFSSM